MVNCSQSWHNCEFSFIARDTLLTLGAFIVARITLNKCEMISYFETSVKIRDMAFSKTTKCSHSKSPVSRVLLLTKCSCSCFKIIR